MTVMDDTTQARVRWFQPTPGHVIVGLLAVECLLWLSERMGWLGWHKGCAVLTGVALVSVAMVLMLGWFGVALGLRRRFQFSLRTLLVLVVVVALPFSWLAVEMKKVRQERMAVGFFLASGCIVFDDECTDKEGDLLVLDHRFADLLIIRDRGPLTRLLGRDFFHSTRTIAHWRPLYQVGPYDSSGMPYTKRDVAEAMLFALKDISDLRTLDLSNMPINDCDLDYVMLMKELRQLDLSHTRITDEGVAKLQQALPNCKITH